MDCFTWNNVSAIPAKAGISAIRIYHWRDKIPACAGMAMWVRGGQIVSRETIWAVKHEKTYEFQLVTSAGGVFWGMLKDFAVGEGYFPSFSTFCVSSLASTAPTVNTRLLAIHEAARSAVFSIAGVG